MIARQIPNHIFACWALLVLPAVSWGFHEPLRAELIENVERQKPRYSDLSVEVSVFTWTDLERTKLKSTEYRRVLQWHGRLYDCVCRNTPKSKAKSTAIHFTWNDGQKTIGYYPPDRVTIHQGEHRASTYFEPYDLILNAIGAEQTLSEFLRFDGKTMDAWKLELAGDNTPAATEYDPAADIVFLRAVRQLPGSKFSSVIELKLSKDHAYLPVWGQVVEVVDNVRQVKAVAEVFDFTTVKDCGPLFKRFQVSTYAEPEVLESSSLIEVQAERIVEPPGEHVFNSTPFVGNPDVIRYDNDRETSREKYRPIPAKKQEPWPPFTIWLVMNDIIAGGIGLALLIRFINRYLKSSVDGRKES